MSGREILWRPDPAMAAATRMAQFTRFAEQAHTKDFRGYNDLWEWSVDDLDAFWQTIWDFFEMRSSAPHHAVLADRSMPGAVWFPGARLNFAEHMLRQGEKTPERVALIVQSETFGEKSVSWGTLRTAVGSLAAHLRDLGVGPGDRVVAVLPNTEASVIACLACASLGAIWSLCAPDMGHVAILDRFRQIEPKVLIAQDGYEFAGKSVDRRTALATICAGLPGLAARIWIPVAGDAPPGALLWDDLLTRDAAPEFAQLPFDHPLWVVYSSGTTGNPKPIVHGHGGVLLEGAKQSLHQDISADSRFCWLTSSGWIMWNAQFMALGQGACVAMFDQAAHHPNLDALWVFAARHRLTYLGAGAAFFASCLKEGIDPSAQDLGALHGLGSTGSPLSEDSYDWIYAHVRRDIWLAPIAGGTDLCGTFVLGNPMEPVRRGEMQVRALGCAVRAFDEDGNTLIGEVGELVCTAPLPAMPLFLWGDDDGSRLHSSYFDTYPGIWRHGDWIEITPEGGSVIYGRSDATINRRGLRLGSAEIYQAVEAIGEITDSLVVDLEFLGKDSFMPLFVVLRGDRALDDALRARIVAAIRESVSPRFVPDEIRQVAEIPRTLSGKKLEVPVKKLLLGGDAGQVVNRDSMANPDSFDFFIAYAAERA